MLSAFLMEESEVIVMYKGFYGWSLENIGAGKVETKYSVELINDKKTWDKFLRTEDLDYISKREYDNISDALTFYLTWYVNKKTYLIHLWEHVFVNGEMVLEQCIEPKSTMQAHLRESVDMEMKRRMYKAEQNSMELRESNNMYRDFIKLMGKRFEEMFEQFLKERSKTA